MTSVERFKYRPIVFFPFCRFVRNSRKPPNGVFKLRKKTICTAVKLRPKRETRIVRRTSYYNIYLDLRLTEDDRYILLTMVAYNENVIKKLVNPNARRTKNHNDRIMVFFCFGNIYTNREKHLLLYFRLYLMQARPTTRIFLLQSSLSATMSSPNSHILPNNLHPFRLRPISSPIPL